MSGTQYRGWVGVDFDGTLAAYMGWVGAAAVPAPVVPIVELVKAILKQGHEVRIFTARIYPLNTVIAVDTKREFHGTHLDNAREDQAWVSIQTIRDFCALHLGQVLPITNVKDFSMTMLYDDRCRQVMTNDGRIFDAISTQDDML